MPTDEKEELSSLLLNTGIIFTNSFGVRFIDSYVFIKSGSFVNDTSETSISKNCFSPLRKISINSENSCSIPTFKVFSDMSSFSELLLCDSLIFIQPGALLQFPIR